MFNFCLVVEDLCNFEYNDSTLLNGQWENPFLNHCV